MMQFCIIDRAARHIISYRQYSYCDISSCRLYRTSLVSIDTVDNNKKVHILSLYYDRSTEGSTLNLSLKLSLKVINYSVN